jgi:hypothetical protein
MMVRRAAAVALAFALSSVFALVRLLPLRHEALLFRMHNLLTRLEELGMVGRVADERPQRWRRAAA